MSKKTILIIGGLYEKNHYSFSSTMYSRTHMG
jgi:hypothetical protein